MAVDYETYQNSGCFGSLDGFRRLAIAPAIWFHTRGEAASLLAGHVAAAGIQAFFVLSGFLAATDTLTD